MAKLSYKPPMLKLDLPKYNYSIKSYQEFKIIPNANIYYLKLMDFEPFETYFKTEMISSQTTIITQMTLERIPRLITLIKKWMDEISVVFFMGGENNTLSIEFLSELYSKHPILFQERIKIHLVYNTTSYDDYPINKLRNIAWMYSTTPFIFTFDIDFLPNSELSSVLDDLQVYAQDLVKKMINNELVFVVPAFDFVCIDNEKFETCHGLKSIDGPHQRPSLVNKWWHSWKPYKINYEIFYEPYIIGSRDMPKFDESFGIGNDKVSHCYELEADKYEWWVLNRGHIAHIPHSKDIIWSLNQKNYNSGKAWHKFWHFAIRIWKTYQYKYVCEIKHFRTYVPPFLEYCLKF